MAPSQDQQLLAKSPADCAKPSGQIWPLLIVCEPHSMVATLTDGVSWRAYPKSECFKVPGGSFKVYDLISEVPEYFFCILLFQQITQASTEARGEELDADLLIREQQVILQKRMWDGNYYRGHLWKIKSATVGDSGRIL